MLIIADGWLLFPLAATSARRRMPGCLIVLKVAVLTLSALAILICAVLHRAG
jgi:hypothetical protein